MRRRGRAAGEVEVLKVRKRGRVAVRWRARVEGAKER